MRDTTPWRQGYLLNEDAIEGVSLPAYRDGALLYWVVVSHSCDLANRTKELKVEVIPAVSIKKISGTDGYAKSARKLHLEFFNEQDGALFLELNATDKQYICKETLFRFEPNTSNYLTNENLSILQHWLAFRYYRAAFPEYFAEYLKRRIGNNRKETLIHVIEEQLEQSKNSIRALLFDLTQNEEIAPENAINTPYKLGIYILYDSQKPDALSNASTIAENLSIDFEKAFNTNGSWQYIELDYCEAISDAVMTVNIQQNLKRWNLEHISMKGQDGGEMLSLT